MMTNNKFDTLRRINGFGIMYKKARAFYLSKSKKSSIIIVCGFGIIIGLIVFSVVYANLPNHKVNSESHYVISKTQDKKELSVASQMQANANQELQRNVLQNQLEQLQKTIANLSLSQSKIHDLETQIVMLTKSIQVLQENTNDIKEQIAQILMQEQKDDEMESSRVKQLQTQISKLSKNMVTHKYLPISILPFKVMGINFWNGAPMVSISTKDIHGVAHYRLIGQGMRYSHSDWMVQAIKSLSNERKEVIFVNNKNQHVRVEL